MATLEIIDQLDLTPSLREALERMGEIRRRVLGTIHEPQPWHVVFRDRTFASSVTHAAAIEGFALTVDQVEAVLSGEASDAPGEARVSATNYARAWQWLEARTKDPQWVLSEETILTLHFLLSHDRDVAAAPGAPSTLLGQYRQGSRPLDADVNYQGPRAAELPGAMRAYVDWVRESSTESTNPYVLMALSYLNLIALQPFDSQNEAVARLLSSVVVMRAGLREFPFICVEQFFSEFRVELERRCADVLGPRWTPERVEATGWVEWFIERLSDQSLKFERSLHRARAEIDAITVGLEKLGFTENNSGVSHRTVLPVWLAIRGGAVTRRQLGRYLDVSEETLSRDLRKLSNSGLLKPEGKGRSARYLPGRTLAADDAFEQLVEIASVGGAEAVEEFLSMQSVGRHGADRAMRT